MDPLAPDAYKVKMYEIYPESKKSILERGIDLLQTMNERVYVENEVE